MPGERQRSPPQAASEYRFDFGPANSPVAEGYTGVDASAAYSAQRGYGWSAGATQDYTAPKPAPRRTYWWHADPVHMLEIMMVAAEQTKEMVKALLQRLVLEIIAVVPFSGEARGIANRT